MESRPSQQSPAVTTAPFLERPSLAPGVQLVGEMQGTGFTDRQWLIQRNGQFIQVSELLYRAAEQLDGRSTLEQIAARLTESTEWQVTADNVLELLRRKLIPLGLVVPPQGGVTATAIPDPRRATSPLAMTMRVKLIPATVIEPITTRLKRLFAPVILLPLLALVVAAHIWLYFSHGIATPMREALYTPGGLLVTLALVIVAAVVHELGHASALHYGGGHVRGMGAGIYLVYPAFFTDTTDAYRLGRWARVRTDLGGFYFHSIFALAIVALYLMTGRELFLVVVVLIDLDIARQLLPFVRLDGYWALADLSGIPDFFSQLGPFLRSVLPLDRWQGARLPPLKPWVRAVFALYILVTVPALLALFAFLISRLPILFAMTWSSLSVQQEVFVTAHTSGDGLTMTGTVVQMLLLSLPVLGTVYLLYTLLRGPASSFLVWTTSTRARRAIGTFLCAALVTLLAFVWAPQMRALAALLPGGKAAASIDGVPCASDMLGYHVHAHLTILDHGQPIPLQADTGIDPFKGCLYWLHTHDATGIIHVEAPHPIHVTLGTFFDIWGQPLSSREAAGATVRSGEAMRIYVNGHAYAGNPRSIPLARHTVITLEIGPPFRTPPPFRFTAGL